MHPTKENLTYARCKSKSGIIMLEFKRTLKPSCSYIENLVCKNIIDPTTYLNVVWVMGAQWIG